MNRLIAVASVAALIAGCASYDAKTVNVQKPSVYAAHMVGEGFEIGAEAYDTDAKTKAAFDEKLVRKGVYPVQVVIENTSDKPLLIVRDQIELSGAVTNAIRPMSSTEVAEEVEANAIAHAIFGFGILSYAAAENANDEREADYTNKQLPQELIVRPGRMNGGFVFFRLPRGEKLAGKTLTVPVADAAGSGEPVMAEVDL